jgi:transglutaminase-like putative cysteine protease
MIVEIHHRTAYLYSERVFLEPQTIRLRPRNDAAQKLHSFALSVEPAFAGMSENLESEGSVSTFVWFDRLTHSLEFESHAVVETCCSNPFNFVLSVPSELPIKYPSDIQPLLEPYRGTHAPNGKHPASPLLTLVQNLSEEADDEIIPFLTTLNRWIAANIKHVPRATGELFSPDHTLTMGFGAHHDLAHLFVALCRLKRIAARFVGGYVVSTSGETPHHWRTWAEVYLPGGGWRGFDPASGLMTADRHIPVTHSYVFHLTTPLTGVFRGTARSDMRHSVEILSYPSLQAYHEVRTATMPQPSTASSIPLEPTAANAEYV